MQKFLAVFDAHWGYDQRPGRTKVPLHDSKAIKIVLDFARDWRPDVVILGGDMLDCGPVSHHLKGKHYSLEGLRLLRDAVELRQHILAPLEALKPKRLVYHIGNHCEWVNQVLEDTPGLEGIVSVDSLLKLTEHHWQIIPQGGHFKLGKLYFMHGDTIKGGGAFKAKHAMNVYDRNIRFGHYHSTQTYCKHRPLDIAEPKTAIMVPCLCRRGPSFLKGIPTGWVSGFLYGTVLPDGGYSDQVAIITKNRWISPTGKVYCG